VTVLLRVRSFSFRQSARFAATLAIGLGVWEYFDALSSHSKQAVRILLGRVGRNRCTPHLSGPFLLLLGEAKSSKANESLRSAVQHVRSLYRNRRLSAVDLSGRLHALDDLAAGKLMPPVPGQV
jgi:hypothetical protein